MRELLIMRHGKADQDVGPDLFQRPLKDKGKRDAQRIGVWLAQQELIPDLVLASPADNAFTTAEKCCKAMGLTADHVHTDKRLYLADVGRVLQVLKLGFRQAKRILVVGHNPGLETLIKYLADQAVTIPYDRQLLPTAALAHFQFVGELRSRGARLVQIQRPSQLPELFPFPTEDGSELRERPAYYYTQSSVIPYRIVNGQLEVMIITSSKNKHWVIPKGIVEPGLNAQESAAKEAWEEAGIEGQVDPQPIGQYRYEKWGATTTVTVFPMRVSREVNTRKWEESHRQRKWMSVNAAIGMLKQQEVVELMRRFQQQMSAVR